jgi:hypothetical protein
MRHIVRTLMFAAPFVMVGVAIFYIQSCNQWSAALSEDSLEEYGRAPFIYKEDGSVVLPSLSEETRRVLDLPLYEIGPPPNLRRQP